MQAKTLFNHNWRLAKLRSYVASKIFACPQRASPKNVPVHILNCLWTGGLTISHHALKDVMNKKVKRGRFLDSW